MFAGSLHLGASARGAGQEAAHGDAFRTTPAPAQERHDADAAEGSGTASRVSGGGRNKEGRVTCADGRSVHVTEPPVSLVTRCVISYFTPVTLSYHKACLY